MEGSQHGPGKLVYHFNRGQEGNITTLQYVVVIALEFLLASQVAHQFYLALKGNTCLRGPEGVKPSPLALQDLLRYSSSLAMIQGKNVPITFQPSGRKSECDGCGKVLEKSSTYGHEYRFWFKYHAPCEGWHASCTDPCGKK